MIHPGKMKEPMPCFFFKELMSCYYYLVLMYRLSRVYRPSRVHVGLTVSSLLVYRLALPYLKVVS
jgi:hypothetical protein